MYHFSRSSTKGDMMICSSNIAAVKGKGNFWRICICAKVLERKETKCQFFRKRFFSVSWKPFCFPIPIQSEIMIRVNRSLGSASTCNSILWFPVYKDNVALLWQEVLLKDCFWHHLSSLWTQTSGSISRNPRTPHQLHLHAFTQPIMQRKNYALKGNKNGGKKRHHDHLFCSFI